MITYNYFWEEFWLHEDVQTASPSCVTLLLSP